MLIPCTVASVAKRFKAQIAELMRGGNAYFIKNAKGNIVLMAENIKEYDRPLSGFKRRYRKAEASSGSNAVPMCLSPCWCRGCSSLLRSAGTSNASSRVDPALLRTDREAVVAGGLEMANRISILVALGRR